MRRITLETHTPINVALKAGLICTASEEKIGGYVPEVFLSKLVKAGHESVIEHINYSFTIEGISRALLQELARHRHISLSVQSTRWALNKTTPGCEHIYSPKEITEKEDNQKMELLYDLHRISSILQEKILESAMIGIPNDVLKYFIQESTSTKLLLTVNARELRLIFKLRTSSRALLEFQNLCKDIYDIIPEDHKFLYSEFFN